MLPGRRASLARQRNAVRQRFGASHGPLVCLCLVLLIVQSCLCSLPSHLCAAEPAAATETGVILDENGGVELPAPAGDGVPPPKVEKLFLKNGDAFTGTKQGETDGRLIWKLDYGDLLAVPLDQVDRIELPKEAMPLTAPPAPPEPPAPPPVTAPPPPVPPTPEALARAKLELERQEELLDIEKHPYSFTRFGRRARAAIELPLKDWTKRFTLGARYLTGNSDESNVNTLADFEHKTTWLNTQVQFGGQFGQSNGVRGTNRWYASSTTDFTKTKNWIYFIKHMDEYDEFQNLDYRGTLSGGIGYRFYDEPKKRLITRIGPAGTYEMFRKPHLQRTTFDIFTEAEFRWPLSKRLQLEGKTTVYPNVENLGLFRANSTVTVIIPLDERECWNFQIGIQDQYISRPNQNRLPHDLWTNLSIMYQRK